MELFRKAISDILKKEVKGPIELEVPPDPKLGDFAFPCFTLARERRKSPVEIAKELATRLKPTNYVKEIRSTGPYVNFFINPGILAETVIAEIQKAKESYGSSSGKQRIVIEYPAPNTNKPLHLGHVRNMLLGESIARILAFSGNTVFRVNMNNDRGIHICKSMLAYQKCGKGKTPKSEHQKSDHFVGDYYVLFSKKAAEHPELEEEAREMLLKWEDGEKETRTLWKRMNAWALEGFAETYNFFGISHDKVYNESEHYHRGKEIVMKGLKQGIFENDEKGNVVVTLERFGLPDKVLLRADGTSVYITQDLVLAKLKYDDFAMDTSIYVVGSEQKLHFQQLFKILELVGFKKVEGCYHLAYGMIYLPEGKMKSREGTVVDADDLAAEMIALARAEIEKRHKITPKELEHRSNQIGMGALKFFILKYDPLKDFIFDPKESISFEGETGPYVQYAHARIASILKKFGKSLDAQFIHHADLTLLQEKSETELIKQLSRFPAVVHEAGLSYKPSLVARYLLDLAQEFNEFYHEHQILQEDEKLRDARLVMICAIQQVLKNGLALLGIDAPESM